jgi:hypothetical protein
MVFGINLPDWKNSLHEALNNYVKMPLEQSATSLNKLAESKVDNLQQDLNKKFTEFKETNQKFQKTLILIAFASFLVLTITLTFKENER